MNRAATSRSRWRPAGHSVRGLSHIRKDLPNQDAIAVSAPSRMPAVVAVADGHGGALYFRSDVGSAAAVAAALSVLAELPSADAAPEDIAQAILERWRATLQRHLADHPFSNADFDRKDADQLRANPLLAYGCTLLAAAAFEDSLLYLQLGDGDILAVQPDGRTSRVFPRDPRFAAGQTASLCQPDAAAEFQIRRDPLTSGRPALVLLSTDGYANAFQTDADFLQIAADYLALVGRDGLDSVAARLPAFLNQASEAGSADDVTLAILAGLDALPKVAPDRPIRLDFLDRYGAPSADSEPNRAIFYTSVIALLMLAAFFLFTHIH